MGTHGAFIDLVKAYDTANHELLLIILQLYGAPPQLITVIERLYTDLKVVFKLGKNKIEIMQGVGVRQGDNMAPVLFLFLMAAIGDLLDKIWEKESIQKVKLTRESDDKYRKGQIFRHNLKKCSKSNTLVTFCVNFTIYVDEKAVPFVSRQQLCKGLPLIQKLFTRLGMEMHIGSSEEQNDNGILVKKTKDSKTECVFFAPRPFSTTRDQRRNIRRRNIRARGN
jgi:hypothetical protein